MLHPTTLLYVNLHLVVWSSGVVDVSSKQCCGEGAVCNYNGINIVDVMCKECVCMNCAEVSWYRVMFHVIECVAWNVRYLDIVPNSHLLTAQGKCTTLICSSLNVGLLLCIQWLQALPAKYPLLMTVFVSYSDPLPTLLLFSNTSDPDSLLLHLMVQQAKIWS